MIVTAWFMRLIRERYGGSFTVVGLVSLSN
jgi:hypothetical protein